MSRTRSGPRLWLRKARRSDGTLTHHAVWIIKDGRVRQSTGCREHDRRGAETALAAYLAQKHASGIRDGLRPPASIPVADVLALYGRDIAPSHARPKETAQRIAQLLAFFGHKTLADINGELCRAYAAKRGFDGASRRELEELRAAINHHRREGLCSALVEVVIPPRGDNRDRWLTRAEAAKLIRCAWRYREVQKGHQTGRKSRQHVARFIVAALYTGRRKQAILKATFGPSDGPWLDLVRGVFYGAPGARRSKKRQPAIVVPQRLLAHLRRWQRAGQRHLIEFGREPINSIDKAFAANAKASGLEDVTPHTIRHTAVTWLALEGVDPYEICRYAGITMPIFEEVYAHHHPDFMTGVHRGFSRHRDRHRLARTDANESGQTQQKLSIIQEH